MTRRTWTVEEVDLLTRRSASSTLSELAIELDRPVKMVRWKVKQLNLPIKDGRAGNSGRAPTVWTEERVQYLREHAAARPAAAIAESLGVTEEQVREALHRHKIQGRGVARTHDPEEVERRTAPLRGRAVVDRTKTRTCPGCAEDKPVFQYPSEDKIQSALCEECRKGVRAARWAQTPDEKREEQYLLARLARYSLTPEQMSALIEASEGRCAVCEIFFSPDTQATRMEVDHDHACCPGIRSCGQCVRGLLCHSCNLLVGHVEALYRRGGELASIAAYIEGR